MPKIIDMTQHTPIPEDDPPSKQLATREYVDKISKPKLRTRIYNWIVGQLNTLAFHISHFYFWTRLNWILPIIAILAAAYLYAFCAAEGWWMKEKVVSVVPTTFVRVAKAAEEETVWPDIGDCEQYRPVVQKYFGKLTNEALFAASKESGCIADRISPKNTDGSKDYCLFQITREPLTAQSLDVCVRRAWEKYKEGRVGEYNFSAWYAVCIKENTKENPLPYPVPKYPKIIKNCK